jgi:hypothetical protein
MFASDLLHAWCRTASGHVGQIVGVMEKEDTGTAELIVKLEPPLPKFHGVRPKEFLLHVALFQCEGWNFASSKEELSQLRPGEQD